MQVETNKPERDTKKSAVFLWLLIPVLILNFFAIDWGLPSHYSWAPDSVHPFLLFNAVEKRFSNGWYDKYPPLHYMLLGAAIAPAKKMCDPDALKSLYEAKDAFYQDPSPKRLLVDSQLDKESISKLMLFGRSLNAVMGALISVAMFLAARELFGNRAAWMTAVIVACHPITVFYSHTMNTEAPYFMWAAFGLYCYFKAVNEQRLWSYMGLGLFAALATATKEQAFGLFALLPFLLLYLRAGRLGGQRPGLLAVLKTVGDRKILAGAGVFIAATLLANNLIFNFKGYMDHLAFNAPGVSVLERVHPLTFSGIASLTGETLSWLYQTASLPVICLCILGLLAALARERFKVFAILLPAFSYFVVFIGYIGFTTPRYITPMFYLLAIFGGKFLADLWGWGRHLKGLSIAVACAAIAYMLYLGVGVDVLLHKDPRYEGEQWIAENIPDGAKVLPFSSPANTTCRLPEGPAYFMVHRIEDFGRARILLRNTNPDFIVVNIFQSEMLVEDPVKWVNKFRGELKNMGYEVKAVKQPLWPHPALAYLIMNPFVILAERM